MKTKATNSNLLFREVDNPFLKKTTEGGLVLDGSVHYSGDSGEIELSNKIVGTGIIVDTGPECKELKVGDIIFYDRRGPRPILAEEEILWVTNELNVFTYVRD